MIRRAALAVLLAGGGAGAAHAFETYERDAPWVLLSASADGRTLTFGYESGGCLHDDGRAKATLRDGQIFITIRQTGSRPTGPYEACTSDLRFPRATVRLDEPIRGRRVRGGPPFAFDFPAAEVPRVIGLDRADALRALRTQSFRARTVGRPRRGRVIAQSPPPGTPRRDGHMTVRIRVR